MAQIFDKVSQDFMNAIAGILEAKKVNKHGHDPVGKEDSDIDNDGDTDTSDKYLHNRRKAIGKSINMKKESKDDVPFEGPYKTAADRKDEYGNKVKNVAKHLAKKAMNAQKNEETIDEMSSKMKMKLGLYGKKKKMKEEVEELDEKLSDEAKAAIRHAAGGRGAKVKPLIKIAKMAKKPMGEEAEQIDELSKGTLGSYINKAKDSIDTASYRQGNREALGGSSKPLEKKLTKRHKGISMAVDKLTKEEIEMIEAKLAGVADGAMEGEKHMCATKVFHKEWNEGTPIKTMHADPDADGLIEWYDVMFDHGIERVMTEDMEILQAESHMHSKKKMKEEVDEETTYNKDAVEKELNKSNVKPKNRKLYHAIMKGSSGYKAQKEEVEELDELSTSTLRSYRAKAKDDAYDAADVDDDRRLRKRSMGSWNAGKKILKRGDALRKEEVEELDELSKNTMLRYVSANKKERKAAEDKGDYGKSVQRMRGTDMAVRKYTAKPGSKYVRVPATEEVELDEARGRPKKAGQMDYTVHPVTKEKLMHNNPAHMKKIELLQKNKVLEKPKTEANQHIMNQLQKAKTSMQGGSTIQFTHGQAKHVSGTHAAKLLDKYAGMKPDEKEAFQKKIGHSHEQLMKHV